MGRRMPVFAARADLNQRDIVSRLEESGAHVWVIRDPFDLVVVVDSEMYFVENKYRRYTKGAKSGRGRPLSGGALSGGIVITDKQVTEIKKALECRAALVFLTSTDDVDKFMASKRARNRMIDDARERLAEIVVELELRRQEGGGRKSSRRRGVTNEALDEK